MTRIVCDYEIMHRVYGIYWEAGVKMNFPDWIHTEHKCDYEYNGRWALYFKDEVDAIMFRLKSGV